MKKTAYRFRITGFVTMIILSAFLNPACENDEKTIHPDPIITMVVDPTYVSSDTTISVGQKYLVGIHAEYNGFDKLTNFIANLNGERYLDLGMYSEIFDKEIEITKGLDEIEEWEFIIRDFSGNSSSTYLTIYKGLVIVYGDIDKFSNVHMGAQNSSEYGSFLSLSDGAIYNLEGAYNHSELIDVVYYYDDFENLEENVMASPGANIGETAFPGEFAIVNWETKNTTRYSREKLNVTIAEFDMAANDSILIANSFAFESGGRKTKFLKSGDIYSFVRDGRTGMFKVVSTSGTNAGYIVVDLIIQK